MRFVSDGEAVATLVGPTVFLGRYGTVRLTICLITCLTLFMSWKGALEATCFSPQ
jgi:hypothetical protein